MGKVCCIETSGASYRKFQVRMSNNMDDGSNPIAVDADSNNTGGNNSSPYKADWLAVARVLDRLFLVSFLVVLIFFAISILS